MRKEEKILAAYNRNPVPGISASMITGDMDGIHLERDGLSVNIYTNGTMQMPSLLGEKTDLTHECVLREKDMALYKVAKAIAGDFKILAAREESPVSFLFPITYDKKAVDERIKDWEENTGFLVGSMSESLRADFYNEIVDTGGNDILLATDKEIAVWFEKNHVSLFRRGTITVDVYEGKRQVVVSTVKYEEGEKVTAASTFDLDAGFSITKDAVMDVVTEFITGGPEQ